MCLCVGGGGNRSLKERFLLLFKSGQSGSMPETTLNQMINIYLTFAGIPFIFCCSQECLHLSLISCTPQTPNAIYTFQHDDAPHKVDGGSLRECESRCASGGMFEGWINNGSGSQRSSTLIKPQLKRVLLWKRQE